MFTYLKSLEHSEKFLIESHKGYVRRCAWSPEGRLLATGGVDRIVHLSDAETGKLIRSFEGHTGQINALCWKPDGSRLVSASEDQTLCIWDPTNGELVSQLGGWGEPIYAIAWSHDGSKLAVGTPRRVVVRDLETNMTIASLNVRGDCLAWTPDDERIVVHGNVVHGNREISVWSIATNESRTLGRDDTWRSALALSPDGKWAATPSHTDVIIRDVESGELVFQLSGHRLPPLSLDFSPDGQQLVSAGEDFSIRVWDLQSGLQTFVFRGPRSNVSSVRWHPTGRRLASTGHDVRIWDVSKNAGDLKVRTASEASHAITWSPDGTRIAMAGKKGPIEIFDPEQAVTLRTMPGHQPFTNALAWHPRRQLLASAGNDHALRIWNPETGTLLREFPKLFLADGRSVAWSPDGKWLAAGGRAAEPCVFLIDAVSLELAEQLPGAGVQTQALDWSPDGSQIASVSRDGNLHVWDAQTREQLIELPTNQGPLWCLAWSSLGDRLAVAGNNGRIGIWETETWQRIDSLTGHTSIVYSLDWNNDDSRLASSSHDGMVILWDGTSYTELLSWQEPDQAKRVSWDPDSLRMASVNFQGYLHVRDARYAAMQGNSLMMLTGVNRRLAEDPNDLEALHLRWSVHRHHGHTEAAKADRQRLMVLYQQKLSEAPNEALAMELAELLLNKAEPATTWTVLEPTEMKSAGGATLTLLEDKSILANGKNPDQDAYQITATMAAQHITAIRLEAIPHASLPKNGPGRYPRNGNFHLNEFRVLINGTPLQPEGVVVSFSDPSVEQRYRYIIDGRINANHWSIYPRSGQSHSAVFATDLELGPDDTLTLELFSSRWRYSQHNLGRFRLSVSDDPSAYANARIRLAAMKTDDPWTKLAVAYQLIGDEAALDKLLERQPTAAVGIGDLYATDENWQEAIELYSKLITDQTTDVTLLSERAAAYIATKQWDLAKSDWLRVIDQQPGQLQQAFHVFRQAEQWTAAAQFGLRLIEQQPENSILWMQVATMSALSGNEELYVKFCQSILKRSFTKYEAAERAIKTCLLRPGAIDISDLPSETLATTLDDSAAPDSLLPWGWATRALLAYRSGDADSAVKYVLESEEYKPVDLIRAMNLSVLALAQHELGHPDEARKALDEARQLISQLQANEKTRQNNDLLIARILFREAESKINGKAGSKPQPAPDPDAKPRNDEDR